LLDYGNPNPKITSKEYQAECSQNEFPLDSLFQFLSFYHGENMWKILLSELVHDAAVRGGFCLIFLRKSENRDKIIVQYTIGCMRYKVYGRNKENVPNAINFKGKYIGPDKLHADGMTKMAIKGGLYERHNLDGRQLPRRRYNMLVKLLPLPHPPVRARTGARTNPSAQRATHLRSVLAHVYAVSRQNQITTTVP
jgi:hypothetical protein